MTQQIPCRMKDGTTAVIVADDLGVRTRCLRGSYFEVYTARFTIWGWAKYSRVSRAEADASGNVAGFRRAHDLDILHEMGVDVAKL